MRKIKLIPVPPLRRCPICKKLPKVTKRCYAYSQHKHCTIKCEHIGRQGHCLQVHHWYEHKAVEMWNKLGGPSDEQ